MSMKSKDGQTNLAARKAYFEDFTPLAAHLAPARRGEYDRTNHLQKGASFD